MFVSITWNCESLIGNFVSLGSVQKTSFQPSFTPPISCALLTPSASIQVMFEYSVARSDHTRQWTRSGWPGTGIRVSDGDFVTPMLRAFL